MKRYILFGLSLLLAFPVCVSAQDDDTEDNDYAGVVKSWARKAVKRYDTKAVKGRVIDAATGKPLSGAIVKASGVEGYSSFTDDNGNYEVKVPVFSTSLYISAPDYSAATLGIAEGQQKDVKLVKNVFRSDYKEQTDILNTVASNDFKYSNSVNIKEDVQEQLGAYAYSTRRNGTSGIGTTMFVQGLNSLNINAQPLVVVDGVIMDQQYDATMLHNGFYNDLLSNINPADIETVEVMRNGTALYGARGANGVIIVKTKRSHSMKTLITANLSVGVAFQPKKYDMMNGEQYRNYASELLKGTGTELTEFKFLNPTNDYYKMLYGNNTDWSKEIYHDAFVQNFGVAVEGGDDVAQYDLSVGYTKNNSTLKYNDMSRLNIRFNTDISLTQNFDVRFDASFSNLKRALRNDGAPTSYDEGTPSSPSFLGYVKSPFISPYAFGGGEFSKDVFDLEEETYLSEALENVANYNWKLGNPWALNQYADAEIKNSFENSMFNIAITPKYRFRENLSLSEHFSYTLINTNEKFYLSINGMPRYYVKGVSAYRDNEVRSLSSKHNSVQSDTRLDWFKRYDAHNLRAFGGMRINFESYTNSKQLAYNTGSDKTPYISNGQENPQVDGVDNTWRNMDVYGQFNYDFRGRYLAQFNLTGSASSRFGDVRNGGMKFGGVVWGIFPALQTSWVMTNEKWLADVKWLDYLRLTAGFDMSGNDNFDVLAAKTYFSSNLYLNKIAGLTIGNIGNTSLKWESTFRWNAGVEANFLNNRLHTAVNLFTAKTTDLISIQTLSMLAGVDANLVNGGAMSNKGLDVTISGKPVVTKDWSWEVGASMGHYKNKITSLPGKDYFDTNIYGGTIRSQVGHSANAFYGYQTAGVFATTAEAETLKMLDANGSTYTKFEAGDVKFVDQNNDGIINDDDRVFIGNPNPDIYGNIFTSLQWKRLRLDMNFNYSVGNDIYNYMRSQLEGGSRFMNQTMAMTQRWMAEGDVTSVPKASFQDPRGNSRFSDRWIEDGSYLKLKSVTVSYNLPLQSQFIQGVQFWIQGNNLFTITKYLGTDPEMSATNSVIGQGIDPGCIGISRNIVAGVKINL